MTTTQKHESLRLAEVLDALDVGSFKNSLLQKAAAELRRQHARITELDEQMTGCIKLLKRTPKITRDIYVGKDRQAWGVKAKAVLDAAIAVQTKKGEQSND